ncbi:MAG: rhomboid family intramembrane serine protease [Lachnospiraceae bacterium]|nr:rhomboid family intramembrane serine protease [Lachnospiraceae bacterium]
MKKKLKFRIKFNAPVVLSFGIACLAALILGWVSGGVLTELLFMSRHTALWSPMTYIRAFTHVLGHSGWEHFIGNMAYILLLGPMLEEKYGSKKVLEVILITAFVTALANYILFPRVGICGASGVVFAFILLTSFTGFKEGEIPLSFILVALIFLGKELIQGLFVRDNISNLSHILGGIVGACIGYALNRKGRS